MSSSEEIRAVFEDDIHRKTRQVVSKFGMCALLDGLEGGHIENLYSLDDDDMELLGRLDADA